MVRLEKFSDSDFEQLITWVDSEELMLQFAGPVFKFPVTNAQLEEYIKPSSRMVFKVVSDLNNQTIGHCEIGNINKENQSASLCRLLIGDKSMRGKGIGQSMISQLLKICFTQLNLHRVELWVYDFNRSAISCYKKSGFRNEGIARDALKVKDGYWSANLMSILKPEWTDR